MNDQAVNPDWKAMYMLLFHGIVEAAELLPVTLENAAASQRLSKALQDAEECYMEKELPV